MELDAAATEWDEHGFAILPGYLPAAALEAARTERDSMFPSAAGFHDGTDPRRERYVDDEFNGIDAFPFRSTELSLLATHERIIALAERLLDHRDVRIYSAEAWAKFTGAADYEQHLHRDYLNHTILVPSTAPEYRQLEMFVFLDDVTDDLGPPKLVSRKHTAGRPALPNWTPPAEIAQADRFIAPPAPELYEVETAATGPAGTVVVFALDTYHRGTALRAPRGARYTMHLNFRRAEHEWGQRHAWAERSHERAWYRYVARATPRQLELFGFPPPGHPFWTPATLDGIALRYPGLDLTPWLTARGEAGTRP